MPKIFRRPRLTYRVVRGLRAILPLADVELCNGEHGAFCQGLRETPLSDVGLAVGFLDRLITWYDKSHDQHDRLHRTPL